MRVRATKSTDPKSSPELPQNNALDRTERSELKKRAPRSRQNGAPRSTASRAWGIGRAWEIRHALKCRICNHPDRAAIEFDFLNWRNPADLVKAYHFRGLSTIYRHAHATGLFAKRRLNLRFAMERIVERVNEVPVTATAVIRAARAITRINDAGQWVDPPSHLVIHHAPSEAGSCSGRKMGPPRSTASRAWGISHVPGIAGRDASAVNQGRREKPRSRKGVRLSLATRHSLVPSKAEGPLTTVFDDALLDEPSESAESATELPRISGKPAPPEVILTFTPEFQAARNERNRAIEADRRAKGEVPSAPSSSSLLPQAAVNASAAATQTPPRLEDEAQNESSGASSSLPQRSSPSPEKQTHGVSSTLLPQAASPNSAPSALKGYASPPASNLEPPASRTAASPQLGSSGSSDPPFPFVPRVPLKWKARRHFLIENEMRSRGESND
jgi:hypothetical protein